MGWIARSQLASAVSAARACGIIETSSGELDAVKSEIRAMRDLSDRPFGVNFGGDMEAAIALTGQVAGRIDSVRTVADIIDDTVSEFERTVIALANGSSEL